VHADWLIHARWVAPVEPDDQVLEHCAIALQGERILALLPSSDARAQFQADQEVELPQHLLIPGLVNAHTHVAMTLFRGLADDLPLMTWLHEHIWPAEKRWVHEEFVADGTRLAVAEMVRGGTTCFNDMYFFPDVTARVAAQAGMRAVVGMIVIDFPSTWADGHDEYFAKAITLHDQFRAHPLIGTAFAPHAPYSVNDAGLARVRKLADELDQSVHIHLHETADEVRQSLQTYGKRPLSRLHDLGLLSPSLLAVHMTQLLDQEIEALALAGAHVVHCPESNLKLASGFCPVKRLLDAGINVALGTDGAASNNDLNLLAETRSAALLAKGVAVDARALPAAQALRLATLGGARALGLDAQIGSLLPGKSADLVAVNLGYAETQPVYHPVSQLVYAADRSQVSDVWVAGRSILRHGELTTLSMDAVLEGATRWRDRVAEPATR
jgi:5-methylthioadenosine/S-adenosylhomocysteine deaminase